MKDFDSIYNKLCLNYKQQVDMVTEEYKLINKEALKKVFTIFIIASIILGGVSYYLNDYIILLFLAFLIVPLLIVFFIIRAKKIMASNIFDDELPLKIYRSVLEEIPYELTYNNL